MNDSGDRRRPNYSCGQAEASPWRKHNQSTARTMLGDISLTDLADHSTGWAVEDGKNTNADGRVPPNDRVELSHRNQMIHPAIHPHLQFPNIIFHPTQKFSRNNGQVSTSKEFVARVSSKSPTPLQQPLASSKRRRLPMHTEYVSMLLSLSKRHQLTYLRILIACLFWNSYV